ncbi:MAG: VWA domain-containing protein, partial [Acidobacteriota bacterium]|nr:VWA domain-containing protein [Acidobacteriota bacterium]
MHRTRVVLLLTLIATPPMAFPAEPPHRSPSADSMMGEDVRVRRVVWPVIVRDKAHDPACDLLGPSDIILEEDGAAVEITAVEAPAALAAGGKAPRVPVVHALLIDTSISMQTNDRLRHAKEAAKRYVDLLPPNEEILIAAFDDSMVLVSPPTTDRRNTREAIDRVELGNWTALWDAVYDLILYLDTLPGQKVAVL